MGDETNQRILPTEVRAVATELVWRCTSCGFQRQADDPPERCPNCGARKEDFYRVTED